jgi:hypothetical protein
LNIPFGFAESYLILRGSLNRPNLTKQQENFHSSLQVSQANSGSRSSIKLEVERDNGCFWR